MPSDAIENALLPKHKNTNAVSYYMVFAYSQDDSMGTCYDKWDCKAT